jgi:hypothetical protein
MYVAVIRGDLSKALFLADLEPKSTSNPAVEPYQGQVRYISRPNPTAITAYLTAQSLTATAAALIAACVPVDGPVDISPTTIKGVGSLSGASNAQVAAIQGLLAYKLVETDVVKKSFLSGNIAGYRSASFNPDSRREPALTSKAAIAVVQDDGVTAVTFAAPVITTADLGTPTAGALRITGTNLLGAGLYKTSIILLGTGAKRLTQAVVEAAGGTFTATQINIPASLIPGVVTVGTTARVQTNDLLSAAVALS